MYRYLFNINCIFYMSVMLYVNKEIIITFIRSK